MKRKAFAPLVSLVTAFLGEAHAIAAASPDPTGLWYDAQESGWGLTIAKQGDVAFAVLFVYDEARRPAWYAASGVHTAVNFGPNPGAADVFYVGKLYRTSGPWFGAAFDPAAVTISEAGTLELAPALDGTLKATYVIDGKTYVKTVQRQTWDSNLALLTGAKPIGQSIVYAGRAVITSTTSGDCPQLDFGGPAGEPPSQFAASTSPFGPNRVLIGWGTGTDTVCLIEGPYTQTGQLGSISGHMRCGPIGFTPAAGDPQVDITEIAANTHGFAGAFSYQSGGCKYTGHFGGVRVTD